MAERRRYSARTKARAVGIALVENAEVAAERTGIPRRTIGYWMDHPEFAALRLKTREEVAETMWVGVQVGVEEVIKGIKGDAPLRDKAVALGILWDKQALMSGQATSRSEHTEMAEHLDDHEAQALSDLIDEELKRRESGVLA